MKIKHFIAIAVLITAFLGFGQNASAVTIEELLAQIAQLQAQIQALQAQLNTGTSATAAWCYTFNTNMGYGATGADFEALITALDKEGIMEFISVNKPSEYNEVIGSGVVEFQKKYASEVLTPYGLKNGTGYVGKSTRAKLNKIYGCSTTPVCTPSWICGSWSTCANGQQTRTCSDENSCGVTTNKPAVIQTCSSTQPSITVTSPNGGETWKVGSLQKVTWTSANVPTSNMTIVSLIDPNNNPTINMTTVTNKNGQAYFIVPSTVIAGQYKAHIKTVVNGVSYIDTSDGYITVSSATSTCTPSWICGSWSTCANGQQTRTCSDENSCGVTIDKPAITQVCETPSIIAYPTTGTLMDSSPTLWVDFVVSNYTPNGTEKVDFGDGTVSILGYTTAYNSRHDYHSAGIYTVKLLAGATILATTQVTVTSSTQSSITVTSAGGSDIPGHNLTFSWTASGVSTVDLSLKNSSNIYVLATGVSASAGSYSVRIPADAVLGTYSMVVSSGSTVTYGGQFSIVAPTAATITVTSPNGEELWIVENLQTVRFMNTGVTGTAWIYLDKYSGSTITKSVLVGAFPLSTSKQSEVHSFSLSRSLVNSMGGPGNRFKIRVLSNASGTPQDTSDNYFTIADPLASSDMHQNNLASISDAVSKLAEQIKSLLSK